MKACFALVVLMLLACLSATAGCARAAFDARDLEPIGVLQDPNNDDVVIVIQRGHGTCGDRHQAYLVGGGVVVIHGCAEITDDKVTIDLDNGMHVVSHTHEAPSQPQESAPNPSDLKGQKHNIGL